MKLIFYILIIGLIFFKSEYCTDGLNRDYISKHQSNYWRGFFALWIVICHCPTPPVPVLDSIFGYLQFYGFLAVAAFFFFSGYGVQYNYIKFGNEYKRSFPKKRFVTLIIPYVIMILVYWGFNAAIDDTYTYKNVLTSFAIGVPVVSSSWYVIAVILFYACFYLEMIIFKERYNLIISINAALNIFWVLIVKMLGWGYWWYACTTALTLGIAWATYEEKIFLFIKKRYKQVLCCAVLGVLISYVIYGMYEKMLIEQFLNAFFVVAVMLLSMKLVIKNKLLFFLGSISFEIYLIHGFTISLFNASGILTDSSYMFLPVIILTSIAFAYCLNKLFGLIKMKLLG